MPTSQLIHNENHKSNVNIDLLTLTVADEHNNNYRKLPEKALQVLLVKSEDKWQLPGGFVLQNQDLESDALNKLSAIINTEELYIEQLYTWGDVSRGAFQNTVSVSYLALANCDNLISLQENSTVEYDWFTVSFKLKQEQKDILEHSYTEKSLYELELKNDSERLSAKIKVNKNVSGNFTKYSREVIEAEGIAADNARIIGYGIERLRNKIMYTDISFSLMPELFTLTELQKVYEVILDKELLKANFRRKISNMVLETNNLRKSAGHRPSKLYKYNSKWQSVFN